MRFLQTLGVSILLIMILFSCKQNQPSGIISANDVIKKDTMVLLLLDMHLIDADAQLIYGRNSDSLETMQKQHYEQVFNHYHTNTKQFKKSLQYYTQHPKELDDMYIEIVNKLSKLNN